MNIFQPDICRSQPTTSKNNVQNGRKFIRSIEVGSDVCDASFQHRGRLPGTRSTNCSFDAKQCLFVLPVIILVLRINDDILTDNDGWVVVQIDSSETEELLP